MSNINTQSCEIPELVQVFSDNVCQSVTGSGASGVIFHVFPNETDLRHGTPELAANPVEVLAAVAQHAFPKPELPLPIVLTCRLSYERNGGAMAKTQQPFRKFKPRC